jgi:hypothetical protein
MSACYCPPVDPAGQSGHIHKKSVGEDWPQEAARYKWIESEKAGYDLGEPAIGRWVKEHWTGYLRARWVEHLQGTYFWIELDRGDYGLLNREFKDCPQLLDLIVNRIKTGQENLHLVVWAIWDCNDHLPTGCTGQMIDILEAIDINSRRLSNQFAPE